MNAEATITAKGRRGPKVRGLSLYFVLLSVQTAGVAILVVNFVPLYRQMALNFSSYKPDQRPWWMAALLLIQVAYWLRVRLGLPLPSPGHVLLSHIGLFVARITFVSVTSGFSVMFLNRFQDLRTMNYPPLRALLILLMFFSIFCWTLEVERLAKALQESGRNSASR